MDLPKYNKAPKKGEDGITILKRIVEKSLNWILRVNHKEHDFGIDAYLDVISEFGQVTGKTIAAQVKTGSSYFSEKSNSGWTYRGEMSHLNYYLNHDIPVILIIVNEIEEKAYWTLCDASKTQQSGDNWKITIPFHQELNNKSKDDLIKHISPVKDYASQMDHFWKVNKELSESGRIVFVVDRLDIENKSYDELLEGLQRLQVNEDLIWSAKEKVDIWIHGYNDDPRELRDIPEVKVWADKMLDGIEGLSYFLAKDEFAQFLKVLQLFNMKHKMIENSHYVKDGIQMHKVEVDYASGVPFLEKLFDDLNKFTDKHHMPLEINKEISGNIVEYLMGERPPGL